jgi:hypothetical protein
MRTAQSRPVHAVRGVPVLASIMLALTAMLLVLRAIDVLYMPAFRSFPLQSACSCGDGKLCSSLLY